jgi:hypothetical protein
MLMIIWLFPFPSTYSFTRADASFGVGNADEHLWEALTAARDGSTTKRLFLVKHRVFSVHELCLHPIAVVPFKRTVGDGQVTKVALDIRSMTCSKKWGTKTWVILLG